MEYMVSQDAEIILDNRRYLLEAGDIIVVETLNKNQRQALAKKFDNVNNIADYWDTISAIRNHLRTAIPRARRAGRSSLVKDIKEFLDDELEEFVFNLADSDTQKEINKDKIDRAKSVEQKAEFEKSLGDYRSKKRKELIDAFGETPKQATTRLRKEKERRDKLFESICLSISSL